MKPFSPLPAAARASGAVLWLCVALLMAGAMWVGCYGHPLADDFTYASAARLGDFLAVQANIYNSWSARVSSNVLCCLFLAETPLWGYRVIAPVMLMGLVLGFYAFVSAAGPRALTPARRWTAALVLAALFYLGAPSTREGFYWASGALNYLPAMIGALLGAAMLLGRAPPRAWHWPAVFLCATFTGLCNESALFVESLVLMVGATWAFLRRSPARWLWLAALAGCGAAVIVELLCPGIRHRSEIYANSRQFLWSFRESWAWMFRLFLRALGSVGLWGATLLFLPWLVRAGGRLRRWRLSPLWAALFVAAWIALMAAVLFPIHYVSGVNPPGRIQNLFYFIFLLGWFPTAAVAVSWLLRLKPMRVAAGAFARRSFIAISVFALVVAAGMFANGTFKRLAEDIMRRGPSFDAQMRLRLEMITSVRGSHADLIVPALKDPPDIIGFHDLTANAQDWHNRSMADYYGLRSIRTGP
ncbi:MAG: hypothetical protein IT462_02375 [Planctomycetes bacterium]|nr:hypothetical protein [Planctomycetota bacterium]